MPTKLIKVQFVITTVITVDSLAEIQSIFEAGKTMQMQFDSFSAENCKIIELPD